MTNWAAPLACATLALWSVCGLVQAAAAYTDDSFGSAPLGPEAIMRTKSTTLGTCVGPVQELRWGCEKDLASNIGCHNRDYAEHFGYWTELKQFSAAVASAKATGKPLEFYDSVTGKLLFVAPRGRTLEEFIDESTHHG